MLLLRSAVEATDIPWPLRYLTPASSAYHGQWALYVSIAFGASGFSRWKGAIALFYSDRSQLRWDSCRSSKARDLKHVNMGADMGHDNTAIGWTMDELNSRGVIMAAEVW